jgi:hypothetical protein
MAPSFTAWVVGGAWERRGLGAVGCPRGGPRRQEKRRVGGSTCLDDGSQNFQQAKSVDPSSMGRQQPKKCPMTVGPALRGFFFMVPKLRLGTPAREAPLRVARAAKRSIAPIIVRWNPADGMDVAREAELPAYTLKRSLGAICSAAGCPRPAYPPLRKLSSPPTVSTTMVSPGANSPARIRWASGFSMPCWMARFKGRAP